MTRTIRGILGSKLPTNDEVEELFRLIESRIAHWGSGNLPGPLPFDDAKLLELLRREKEK